MLGSEEKLPHEEPLFAEQQLMFVLVRGGSSSELGGLSST